MAAYLLTPCNHLGVIFSFIHPLPRALDGPSCRVLNGSRGVDQEGLTDIQYRYFICLTAVGCRVGQEGEGAERTRGKGLRVLASSWVYLFIFCREVCSSAV